MTIIKIKKKGNWIMAPVKRGTIKFTALLAYMRFAEKNNLSGVAITDKKSGEIILRMKKNYKGKD